MRALRIKRLHPDAVIPKYAHPGDACFDLVAIRPVAWKPEHFDFCVIMPGQHYAFRTGLAVSFWRGQVLQVFSRSGHGFKHGICLSNGTGIIDSNYRGELLVSLHNAGAEPFRVNFGDRIAQAMLVDAPPVDIIEVDELDGTARGANGFGSSGA